MFASLDVAGWRAEVADKIVKEVGDRLRFLSTWVSTTCRSTAAPNRSPAARRSASGSRARWARAHGVMYILDEPSIGLHQRDNQRLSRHAQAPARSRQHRAGGRARRGSDPRRGRVLDIGPGAGVHGGEIVAQGTPPTSRSDTTRSPANISRAARRSRCRLAHAARSEARHRGDRRDAATTSRTSRGISARPVHLRHGVSGSGKSTLVNDTLFTHANHKLNGTVMDMAPCEEIKGLEEIDRIIDIDQSPIGRTPRSNPATYTGLFRPAA
jgi:excinuclease ABC subunit A